MSETDLHRRVLLLSDERCKLFRNNVGHGWQGRNFTIRDGRLASGSARNIAFGLANGSSDVIGLMPIVITPELVGKRVAVFVAIELKSKKGRRTTEQRSFIRMVKDLGGLADVALTLEEAAEIISRDPQ